MAVGGGGSVLFFHSFSNGDDWLLRIVMSSSPPCVATVYGLEVIDLNITNIEGAHSSPWSISDKRVAIVHDRLTLVRQDLSPHSYITHGRDFREGEPSNGS